jgi:hypothetical protein
MVRGNVLDNRADDRLDFDKGNKKAPREGGGRQARRAEQRTKRRLK